MMSLSQPSADELRRLDAQQQLVEAVRAIPLRMPSPYFGHLRLDTGTRLIDVLLGSTSRPGSTLAVVDWHSAPLTEVFFATEEGDEYELDLGDRLLTGRVL